MVVLPFFPTVQVDQEQPSSNHVDRKQQRTKCPRKPEQKLASAHLLPRSGFVACRSHNSFLVGKNPYKPGLLKKPAICWIRRSDVNASLTHYLSFNPLRSSGVYAATAVYAAQ